MVVKIIVNRSETMKIGGILQSGFTLWELLLVFFLMGVLLTLVIPHFGSATNQVWMHIDLANKEKIEGASQLYRIDVGTYPAGVQDLVHTPRGVSGWHGPYLNEIPIDPFNSTRDYQIDAYGQVK